MTFFKELREDRRGATAIEYALIIGLISVAIFSAVQGTSSQVQASMNTAGTALSSANAAG